MNKFSIVGYYLSALLCSLSLTAQNQAPTIQHLSPQEEKLLEKRSQLTKMYAEMCYAQEQLARANKPYQPNQQQEEDMVKLLLSVDGLPELNEDRTIITLRTDPEGVKKIQKFETLIQQELKAQGLATPEPATLEQLFPQEPEAHIDLNQRLYQITARAVVYDYNPEMVEPHNRALFDKKLTEKAQRTAWLEKAEKLLAMTHKDLRNQAKGLPKLDPALQKQLMHNVLAITLS